MKALQKLKRGVGHIEVVNVPDPTPGEDEVVVEVSHGGICGTDVHILHDLFAHVRPPVTLGHEFSGMVAELGSNVVGWEPGDRVTVESAATFCRECDYCLSGETQRCKNRVAHGIGKDGGFANYVLVRSDALHRLPDHISFEEAALTEPLAVAVHAVLERTSIDPDKKILITGPGVIGLMTLQVAETAGARVLVAGTKRDKERLMLASKLGAEQSFQTDRNDILSKVMTYTNGYGADIAFECSGSDRALHDCMDAVRKGGKIVQVGLMGKSIELDYDQIALKEITLKGCFTHNHGTWVRALDLMRKKQIQLKPLISDIFPLDQWEEAFKRFEQGIGLKYLLKPIP